VLFPKLLGKYHGKTRKDGARPAIFLIFVFIYVFFVLFYVFLCCSMYCLFCVFLCTVCVYMCTVLLPPGGYTIAVKYIIYHIFAHHQEHLNCITASGFTHVCRCQLISWDCSNTPIIPAGSDICV
jgi:hypothetical protein